MSADYPSAQEHFVPRSFMFNSNDPIAVIIHKTGGDRTPLDVYNTFLNSGNPGRSSHYAIGLDGSIWQFVPESLGAGANGIPGPQIEAFWQPYLAKYSNLNMCTISVEHCDPSINNDTPLTAAQKQASFALVSHLCAKHKIPPDHIKPHRSIAATDCPGTYPMDELINYVKGGGNAPMQTYNEQSSGFSSWFLAKSASVWECKQTGKTIQFGLKSLYQKLSIDGSALPIPGLPLTGELPFTVKGKQVTVQIFERGILVYDPGHVMDSQPGFADAYFAHINNLDLLKLVPGLQLPTPTPTPAVDLSPVIASLRDAQVSANEITASIAAALKEVGISG